MLTRGGQHLVQADRGVLAQGAQRPGIAGLAHHCFAFLITLAARAALPGQPTGLTTVFPRSGEAKSSKRLLKGSGIVDTEGCLRLLLLVVVLPLVLLRPRRPGNLIGGAACVG